MDTIQEASTAEQKKVPAELEALSMFLMPKDLITSLVPQAPSDPTLPTEVPLTASRLAELDDYNTGRSTPTSLDSALPSCRICGIPQFESVEKQREHVRLDWHRYNLKQQLLDKSAKPISEQQFENMMQDLSSISGSDDSSDDDNDGASTKTRPSKPSNDNDTVTSGQDQEAMILSLMNKLELTVKQNQRARNQDPVLVHQQQLLEQQLQEARSSPMIWFTSSQYDRTVRLGIYKNALPNKGQCDNIPEYLQTLQFPIFSSKKGKTKRANREEKRAKEAAGTGDIDPKPIPQENDSNEEEEEVDQNRDWLAYQMEAKQSKISTPTTAPRYWTLVLIGGGHFAGVVMDLAGQVSSHGRDMKVVAHKTFHRYTGKEALCSILNYYR